jgi:general secretion pathway protein H
LEVMVVILIVGIMATAAVISFGVLGGDRELKDESERIAAVLEQAQEETELQGFDVGLRIGEARYDFLRFDPREQLWLPIIDDNLFGTRELPEGLKFRLWLEGRQVELLADPSEHDLDLSELAAPEEGLTPDAAAKQDEARKKQVPPQIFVLSSGDLNSFELHLEREDNIEPEAVRYKVYSQPNNRVAWEQIDASL